MSMTINITFLAVWFAMGMALTLWLVRFTVIKLKALDEGSTLEEADKIMKESKSILPLLTSIPTVLITWGGIGLVITTVWSLFQ